MRSFRHSNEAIANVSQINFIHIDQNHHHDASVGLTICTVNNILCPQILDSSEDKLIKE